MKRKLQILFTIAMIFSVYAHAQNKIHNSDDLQKLKQLKQYVASHPLAKGQTNWAVETLQKYKTDLDMPAFFKDGNEATAASYSYRTSGGAPVNDDCANAILLTQGATCSPTQGDVAAATESMPADSCGGYLSTNGYDVWFKFVATSVDPYITVTGSASFDPVIFLFDTCGGSMLGCSDATISGETELITATGLTIGNTYYVRVYDYGNALPVTTTFDICVFDLPAPPANDDCANAVLLTEGLTCVPTTGDVAWATESMPPDVCSTFTSTNGYDVWFKFVAVTTNPSVSVTGSEFFDAAVFLLDGCGGSILACSDTSINAGTELFETSGLTIGNTYYVRVYDFGNALPATTTFDICVFTTPVGIAETVNSSMPFLFPNPSSGTFNVQFHVVSEKTTIDVYDVLGNRMKEQVVLNSKEAKLDVSLLVDGIYSVQVQNENGTFSQKIILNK